MQIARLVIAVVLASGVAGCGGKILDDSGAGGGTSGGRSGSAGSSGTSGTSSSGGFGPAEPPRRDDDRPGAAVPPAPSRSAVADACETICRRNAKCGAWQSDCNAYCANEINSAAACSPQANAYIHCYADNLEDDSCTALPPLCEEAYCAYTRCAGKVIPRYCR